MYTFVLGSPHCFTDTTEFHYECTPFDKFAPTGETCQPQGQARRAVWPWITLAVDVHDAPSMSSRVALGAKEMANILRAPGIVPRNIIVGASLVVWLSKRKECRVREKTACMAQPPNRTSDG